MYLQFVGNNANTYFYEQLTVVISCLSYYSYLCWLIATSAERLDASQRIGCVADTEAHDLGLTI